MWQNLLTFKLLYFGENNIFSKIFFYFKTYMSNILKKIFFVFETHLTHPGRAPKPPPEISDKKKTKTPKSFFESSLSKKKVFFFLPPINKNHIFVEKLLTIFFILPLVASTFFVKALSCQKFLPKKRRFSFDFV